MAEEVALHSFDEAVSNTRKYTGGNVPKRQTQEMVVSAAKDFEAFYTQRETDGPEQTSELLVMYPLRVAAAAAKVPRVSVNVLRYCIPSRHTCSLALPDLGEWLYLLGWRAVE